MVSTTWNTTFNYRCPDGFRWITSDEYTENYEQSSTCNTAEHHYYSQCGWNGYTYAGVSQRHCFRFSDSTLTNGLYTHAGHKDGYIVGSHKALSSFAGIVCSAE